jgi:hypothetical protein
LHLHWRRSRRHSTRANALCIGLREQSGWSLQPVLPRQDRFTKTTHRLLHGGKMAVRKHSQSPVLPRTQRAYETHLSTGPTAVLADGQEWSPHPLARPHSAVEPHPQRGQAEGRMTDAETNQPSPFYILHLPFFLREVAECRGLAPLARRHALFSKQARHA